MWYHMGMPSDYICNQITRSVPMCRHLGMAEKNMLISTRGSYVARWSICPLRNRVSGTKSNTSTKVWNIEIFAYFASEPCSNYIV